MHFTEEMLDYPARYILLLPQNIFADFKRRNRILYVKDEEKKWQNMSFKELSEHFLSLIPEEGYIHYNEDYKEYIYQKRYNVFLIKEEGFDKEQVPCYEVQLFIDSFIK